MKAALKLQGPALPMRATMARIGKRGNSQETTPAISPERQLRYNVNTDVGLVLLQLQRLRDQLDMLHDEFDDCVGHAVTEMQTENAWRTYAKACKLLHSAMHYCEHVYDGVKEFDRVRP